jgi:FKBP-type peptidyl-prolyl cis-trans isomerase FklB
MKKTFAVAIALVFGLAGLSAQTPELKTPRDSASYAFGMLVGNSLARQISSDLNMDIVLKALTDKLKGQPMTMELEAASQYYTAYDQKLQAEAKDKNRLEGEKFLMENKKRAEVKTTASGLQYEVLKKGTGTVSPKATDKVTVHYHGTLIDGTVFDSSVERGQTASFGLNQVIPGWTEGLQLMSVGDKFRFYIPANLAYGERSPSAKIKPNSTLIFDVELFSIGQ